MNVRKPIPATPEQWLQEIAAAYRDAREAIPYGPVSGVELTEQELFQLAPLECLKFRGIKRTGKSQRRATDAALSSYVVNEEPRSGAMKNPVMAFSLCYIASHYGLDLIDETFSDEVLQYIERHLDGLEKQIES
jgi:hypothetical protein